MVFKSFERRYPEAIIYLIHNKTDLISNINGPARIELLSKEKRYRFKSPGTYHVEEFAYLLKNIYVK